MQINPLLSLAATGAGAVFVLGWGYLLVMLVAPPGEYETAQAFGVVSVFLALVGGGALGVGVHLVRSRYQLLGWIALAVAALAGVIIPLGLVLSF